MSDPDYYHQRNLIPLTNEELQSKSRLLAQRVVELAEVKEQHAEVKKDMANIERVIVNHIRELARVVRDGAEERDR